MMEESKLKHKPQIVGLTASLGVGETSWDINACKEVFYFLIFMYYILLAHVKNVFVFISRFN